MNKQKQNMPAVIFDLMGVLIGNSSKEERWAYVARQLALEPKRDVLVTTCGMVHDLGDSLLRYCHLGTPCEKLGWQAHHFKHVEALELEAWRLL